MNMKKNKLKSLLGISIVASMISGCDTFNPSFESEMDMYGPAPIVDEQEEFRPELEDQVEDYGVMPYDEDFDASDEPLALLYGVFEEE